MLSKEQVREIRRSLKRKEPGSWSVQVPGLRAVTVSTMEASSVWAPVEMLIRLNVERKHMSSSQVFTRVEDVVSELRRMSAKEMVG